MHFFIAVNLIETVFLCLLLTTLIFIQEHGRKDDLY